MDLELSNRRCLVTGASAGLGAGIVEALVAEGAHVVAVARRREKLEALAQLLSGSGLHRPVIIAGDITQENEITRIVGEASESVGPIEVFVNSAGGSTPVTPETGDDVWDEAYDLNFRAMRRLTTALLPEMRKARWGRIINVTALMEPLNLNAAMSAKASAHIWAKGLSREVAAEGITINSIAPGRLESEQVLERLYPTERSRRDFVARHVPIGYFGKPADLANLVAFLASPRARYITGTIIPVDGGMKYGL